jgi:ankyrin repeat protein
MFAVKDTYSVYCKKQERDSLESLSKHSRYSSSEWLRVKDELAEHVSTDMSLNDNDTYGDGDQSLVHDHKEQQFLKDLWSAGADVEYAYNQGTFSDFITAVMNGDLKTVQKILADTDDKTKLLEKRHTILRLPALFLAVVGHRIVSSPVPGDAVGVVISLLENGARCDARDLLGKTIIDYAVGALSDHESPVLLNIADLCIARSKEIGLTGSLVDYQDRFGDTPLMMAVIMNREDLVTHLLKKHADSSITNLDNISSLDIAPEASAIKQLLINGSHKLKKIKCNVCKKFGKTFLCARCNHASYCSKDCQKADWKEHKLTCGLIKFDMLITPIRTGLVAADLNGEKTTLWTGNIPKNIKINEIFEVKIQVGPTSGTPFELNDEKKELFTHVNKDVCEDYLKLYDLVRSFASSAGRIAYFKAKFESSGRLLVSSSEMFVRKW